MIAPGANPRAKFIDELNYFSSSNSLDDLLVEIESASAALPKISRLSSWISTFSEELQTLGFSIRHKVKKFYNSTTGRAAGEIPIVCTKFGIHIALAVCETKPEPKQTRILLDSKFDGKVLVIRRPTAYAKGMSVAPPAGIHRQLFLNQRISSPTTIATPPKSAAGKGTRVGGTMGGQGVGDLLAVGPIVPRNTYGISRNREPSVLEIARARGLKPGKSRKLDWSAIDRYGNPIVSFDPGHPLHEKIVKAISTEAADVRLREVVLDKLTTETSRIYERYRREELKSRGYTGSSQFVPATQRPKLEQIAIGCINLGITPRQVLEFWHSRVGDYTHGQHTIPSLGFLSRWANLDMVACSGIGALKTAKKELKTAEDRNPFSALDGLDVKLRGALERGGFDTIAFNDRYLLSIQHNALALAAGKNLFVADGKFGRMIRFAAENLYARAS